MNTIFLLLIFFPFLSLSDLCLTFPTHQTHRSDQITVLINGYSESRIPLLNSIATSYSSIPTVAAVLILWGNSNTPIQTLTQLSHNLSFSSFGAPISLLRQPSESLNSRFLPRSMIKTAAVAICDDDVEIDKESFEFGFRVWGRDQDRLVGFFARSHDIDLMRKSWIYSVHPDKYSIMLTKLMILNVKYLYKYSCGDGKMREMRNVVDEMMNCEDILMNFVVADEVNAGPILVEGKRLRDHGDARNDNEDSGETSGSGDKVRDVGLSSRRKEHRKRRGDCIREFHRVTEKMPLKYSYGKMVNSVGEQGLCDKGGKLVHCDEQIF
ncbi:lactose synthase [Ranunculus cassubicifolius]